MQNNRRNYNKISGGHLLICYLTRLHTLIDRPYDLLRVQRFGKMPVHPCLTAPSAVLIKCIGRHRYDWDHCRIFSLH